MHDTLSPALQYGEAMFYKRITRQRAPTGHPLPPRATCEMHNRLTDFMHTLRNMLVVCIYICPASPEKKVQRVTEKEIKI